MANVKYINIKLDYIKLMQSHSGGSNSSYPFYNKIYKLTRAKFRQLAKDFEPKIVRAIPTLQNSQTLEKYDGGYVVFEENWNNTNELNKLTDYFTESCRIKCEFRNNISPFTYWKQHKHELINNSIAKYGKINLEFMRNIVGNNTRSCSNFRISVAITVLRMFKPKRWLDISAGWGDRLISAIACDIDMYCGVDPNKCLHPKYKKIIKKLVPNNERHKYVLIEDGFETANLPNVKFDLVFSSPPFFDREIYSESKQDSVNKYNKLDDWFDNFLMASVKKAFMYMENDGHLILHMGEGNVERYVANMIEQISKFMQYMGIIYYFYPDRMVFRPMYVWIKH